jgi:two-component system, OmpR family, sensor histidine kinase KdpD
LQGVETLPRQIIPYRDQKLAEFDLDAALKRNPAVILIDEMAHTNAPNLRHAYRWQDIKEILDHGIDVYTTLNVQHIESLNDVVSQIVGTRIRETVPDSMIERAETIELVDLPPEDLLKRLQEGKVYIPKQAELATTHFFRKGNLIALRELALRVTAERVGAQVLLYRQGQGIERIWPTQEKLLVCVGSNPDSMKVIRTARRLASSLQAEWIALHIDTPRQNLSEAERSSVTQNLRFAEQLGADTKILSGQDLVKEILNFAREQNVTKIVIEKHTRPRWKNWFSTNLVDELVRYSGEIDIYIITGETPAAKPITATAPDSSPVPWPIYGVALAVMIFVTFINTLLYQHVPFSNLILFYLVGVVVISIYGFRGPSIFASILSVLALDIFFMTPRTIFLIPSAESIFTLIVMFIVSQIISHLTIFTRRQSKSAYRAERRGIALHTLSRQLASTRGVDKLLDTAVRYISDAFDSEVLALLPEESRLIIKASYKTEKKISGKEFGVAQWVYDLGQVAGLGTDTLPFSEALYVPLLASQGPIGVLRIRPTQTGRLFAPEQMHLLEACANQIAIAIEVDRLQEQSRKLELEMETDCNSALRA